MEHLNVLVVPIGICASLLGIFGWSHSNLSKRLDKLAIDLQARKTDADTRVLIEDKLQPFRIELHSLSKQIDMISCQYSELDKKIDAILQTVSK